MAPALGNEPVVNFVCGPELVKRPVAVAEGRSVALVDELPMINCGWL